MTSPHGSQFIGALLLSITVVLGACSSTSRPGTTGDQPAAGSLNGNCLTDGSCNDGLMCDPILNICVNDGSDANDNVNDNGGADNDNLDAAYNTPPDATTLREFESTCELNDGTEVPCAWSIPCNQLVVMMYDDEGFAVAREDVQDVIGTLQANGFEAELAGQIPAISLFQIQIDNTESDPDAALDRLDAALAIVADDVNVESVTYNFLMGPRDYVPLEPEDDDNTRYINNGDRSGLAAIDYYQAIPIFDEILQGRRNLLRRVNVGIVDTGLADHTGQFDDIDLEFVGIDVSDTRGHGTAITALIAADNGDALVNGIASRVLNGHPAASPSKLRVVFGKGDFTSLSAHFGTMMRVVEVVRSDVHIVNLSLGYGQDYRRARRMARSEFLAARNQWYAFMNGERRDSPQAADVLFVVAAPNDDITLATDNDFPSGIGLSNVITVGGIDTDDLYARASFTASGGQINVAAPATNVPILIPREGRPVGSIDTRDGTSYATAMITAMAAIMYAVDPSATPSQVKRFFRDEDNTWPADASASGRRAALIRTVGRYMLQHGNLRTQAATVLDSLGGTNNTPDPSGYIMNQHVSQVGTSVEASGPMGSVNQVVNGSDFIRAAGKFNNSGGIIFNGESTFNIVVGNFDLGAGQTGRFELNRPYLMGVDSYAILAIQSPGSTSADYSGASVDTGQLEYSACEITTRSLPLSLDTLAEAPITGDDAFLFIQVEGAFEARIEGGDLTTDPPTFPVYYQVASEFNTGFLLLNVDQAMRDYLEENCVGGYQYGYNP